MDDKPEKPESEYARHLRQQHQPPPLSIISPPEQVRQYLEKLSMKLDKP